MCFLWQSRRTTAVRSRWATTPSARTRTWRSARDWASLPSRTSWGPSRTLCSPWSITASVNSTWRLSRSHCRWTPSLRRRRNRRYHCDRRYRLHFITTIIPIIIIIIIIVRFVYLSLIRSPLFSCCHWLRRFSATISIKKNSYKTKTLYCLDIVVLYFILMSCLIRKISRTLQCHLLTRQRDRFIWI